MSSDLDQKSHEMFRVATPNNGVLVCIADFGKMLSNFHSVQEKNRSYVKMNKNEIILKFKNLFPYFMISEILTVNLRDRMNVTN